MFGSVDRWLRAFAGLDVTKSVSTWYVGPGPFQASLFASSFSSFSGSLATTVVSTPAGSGGSGFSGGFSRGGGGGGGGGRRRADPIRRKARPASEAAMAP